MCDVYNLKTENMEHHEATSESPPDDSNIGPTLCLGPLPPPYSTVAYELQTVNMEQQAAASESSIVDTNVGPDLLPPSYSISELQQSTALTASSLPLLTVQPPAYTSRAADYHASPLPQQPDQQQQQVVLSIDNTCTMHYCFSQYVQHYSRMRITGWVTKVSHRSLHIISSNTGRFSNFLHCHIFQEICCKAIIKISHLTLNVSVHYPVEYQYTRKLVETV